MSNIVICGCCNGKKVIPIICNKCDGSGNGVLIDWEKACIPPCTKCNGKKTVPVVCTGCNGNGVVVED